MKGRGPIMAARLCRRQLRYFGSAWLAVQCAISVATRYFGSVGGFAGPLVKVGGVSYSIQGRAG